MKIFDLVLPEERTDKQSGEVSTYWHSVGTAFENKRGFSLVIPEGVAITGRVLMFPRDEKKPDSAADAFNEGE